MDVLPDEMWQEIFKYLTIKERKSCRMSCRRWKNHCNHLRFQEEEKLHLPGVSFLEDIVETLLTSQRSVLNLKFSNHRLDGVDLPLWRECGLAIEQLELENCSITLSSMKEILIRCTNLSYLALRNVQIVQGPEMRRFDHTFIRIRYDNVIASSVEKLEFDIYELLSDIGLEALLSIFPNCNNLIFDFHHLAHTSPAFRGPAFHQLAFYDESERPYSCVHFANCLATNMLELEHLKIKASSQHCMCDVTVSQTAFVKLKTAELSNNRIFCHDKIGLPRTFVFDATTRSKYMTSVEISMLTHIKRVTKILRQYSSLRKIEITPFNNNFDNFMPFFEALTKSNLETITIHNIYGESSYSLDRLLRGRICPRNSTIEELNYTIYEEDDSLISVLLKCFSGLTRLRLTIKCRKINLPTLFHHTNLKCVEFEANEIKDLFPQDPTTVPEKPNLFNETLEYLSLNINILRTILIQEPAMYFSKLRYLHLSNPRIEALAYMNSDPSKIFTCSLMPWEIRCFPLQNLEGVYINVSSNFTTDVDNFFSSPSNFPRIQYIGIELASPNVLHYKTKFEKWFEDCPCLTTVFILYKKTGICLYYDPVRGEVRECRPENMDPYEDSFSDLNTGITLFHYFKNLKSFYKFWKNTS